jgi:oxygen-independent coproporphyrinogen-3 oxidase
MLDLDDKSPLYHMIAKGRFRAPEDDFVSDWYLQTIHYLCSRDYDQYEISNFARPGYACRHNLKYWLREPVLGFGVGSHSFDGRSRYANYSNMCDYLRAVEAGGSPVEWQEPVASSQALEESLFLGLRLNRGIDWDQLQRFYDDDRLPGYESSLRAMSDRGLLEWEDRVVRLTPLGMLLSNEIFQQFI